MPELPEVTTTVNGINEVAKNLTITDVWSDWPKLIKSHKFPDFKREISSKKIIKAERRAKNILVHLSGDKTLLIHMKMTGHVMYGKWRKAKKGERDSWKWLPESDDHKHPLNDPYNRFLHLILFLSNGHQLALSDTRKFAKIELLNTKVLATNPSLKILGPEPLDEKLTLKIFDSQLNKKPSWPIKQALMNQELIAGIGNIYSDEILWEAAVHPLQKVSTIPEPKLKKMYKTMKEILQKSIRLGGDSMSDYRNIHGERGGFQNVHKVYRRTGERCAKKNCGGIIRRIKVAGRSAHFCDTHQKLI
ncbi:MAG: bifunctional DNA-formamidopyrimidine glycosylase/DNA-(apurinic or apyrimidinic site) lyase [Candidatus Vogelbacteria bacterium]|nr:bifunctional DNA-formamidopyrimidine glycosylase/DNA-(apurinic or apyrimidinic site) lyase [Candidatus Vogelbacteria bacterium]